MLFQKSDADDRFFFALSSGVTSDLASLIDVLVQNVVFSTKKSAPKSHKPSVANDLREQQGQAPLPDDLRPTSLLYNRLRDLASFLFGLSLFPQRAGLAETLRYGLMRNRTTSRTAPWCHGIFHHLIP